MSDCCWHTSDFQHLLNFHRDEVCCLSGRHRCVTIRTSKPTGHGPHLPSGDVIIGVEVADKDDCEGPHWRPGQK